MKHSLKTLVTVLAMAIAGAAAATPVVSLFGADDGMGIGLMVGEEFFPFDLVNPGADGSGDWMNGFATIQHANAFTGTVIGAVLEIFSGGWGYGGATKVNFNGNFLGYLTSTDPSVLGSAANRTVLDSFDFSGHLDWVTGHDLVSFEFADALDFGAIGFSRLTLQVNDTTGGGTGVPEPATFALAALALAGVALQRRRR